ncbi:MAG: response regulator, partial [Helicobacteraceae bacterium]|nr:response regulator [Helicobacteraceae bacterium]
MLYSTSEKVFEDWQNMGTDTNKERNSIFTVRILITDDADDVRSIIKAICSKIEGVELYEAVNGQDALDKVARYHPHLVLMDLLMPVMDGFEATKRIKEQHPDVVILVITALIDETVERKARRLGAAGYIHKPIVDVKKTRFKIANFVSFLRVSHRADGSILGKRAAENPFSSEIRVVKTTATIAKEEDMMDFNLWLTERYMKHRNYNIQDSIYYALNTMLFKVVSGALKRHTPTTIWAEESFDAIFLGVSLLEPLDMEMVKEKYPVIFGDDPSVRADNAWLYLRISMRDDDEEERAEQAHQAAPSIKTAQTEQTIAQTIAPSFSHVEPKTIRQVENDEKAMLRQSHSEKISAAAYCDSLSDNDLYEVQDMADIEEEWTQLYDNLDESFSIGMLHKLGKSLMQYSSTINKLFEFATLAYALVSMSKLISEVDEHVMERISPTLLLTLVRGFTDDMKKWRNTIFISRS